MTKKVRGLRISRLPNGDILCRALLEDNGRQVKRAKRYPAGTKPKQAVREFEGTEQE